MTLLNEHINNTGSYENTRIKPVTNHINQISNLKHQSYVQNTKAITIKRYIVNSPNLSFPD